MNSQKTDIHATRMLPPKQQRSRKTLEKILTAIIELLAEREYEDITIAQITAHAGITAGAFYTRFASKELALDYLLIEMLQRQLENTQAFFSNEHWQDQGLTARFEALIDMVVSSINHSSGLARALALREVIRPNEMNAEERQLRADVSAIIEQWLLQAQGKTTDDQSTLVIRFALNLIRSMVNTHLLFTPLDNRFSADNIQAELKRVVIAYCKANISDLEQCNET